MASSPAKTSPLILFWDLFVVGFLLLPAEQTEICVFSFHFIYQFAIYSETNPTPVSNT